MLLRLLSNRSTAATSTKLSTGWYSTHKHAITRSAVDYLFNALLTALYTPDYCQAYKKCTKITTKTLRNFRSNCLQIHKNSFIDFKILLKGNLVHCQKINYRWADLTKISITDPKVIHHQITAYNFTEKIFRLLKT